MGPDRLRGHPAPGVVPDVASDGCPGAAGLRAAVSWVARCGPACPGRGMTAYPALARTVGSAGWRPGPDCAHPRSARPRASGRATVWRARRGPGRIARRPATARLAIGRARGGRVPLPARGELDRVGVPVVGGANSYPIASSLARMSATCSRFDSRRSSGRSSHAASAGSLPVSPPPMTAPGWFQGRHVETGADRAADRAIPPGPGDRPRDQRPGHRRAARWAASATATPSWGRRGGRLSITSRPLPSSARPVIAAAKAAGWVAASRTWAGRAGGRVLPTSRRDR